MFILIETSNCLTDPPHRWPHLVIPSMHVLEHFGGEAARAILASSVKARNRMLCATMVNGR